MFVHRYYSIGLYILVNLYVLWQGQRLGLAIAYPADGEEDIARQNVQVELKSIYHKKVGKHSVALIRVYR